jgi:hypothetical protein
MTGTAAAARSCLTDSLGAWEGPMTDVVDRLAAAMPSSRLQALSCHAVTSSLFGVILFASS